MMHPKKFSVIAAACENLGIGNNGDLPWRLKNEMAYFSKMTTTTTSDSKRNAVIMGRRTWECIPPKYKPLSNRFNVVISNTLNNTGYEGVPVFKSLTEAVNYLSSDLCSDIELIWIIGGSALYKEAIQSSLCDKIYLTKVSGKFECDTFFPDIPDYYEQIKEDGVPDDIQEEKGISYVYTVLKNRRNVEVPLPDSIVVP